MEWTWNEELKVLSEEIFEKPSAFSIVWVYEFTKSLGFSNISSLELISAVEKWMEYIFVSERCSIDSFLE